MVPISKKEDRSITNNWQESACWM